MIFIFEMVTLEKYLPDNILFVLYFSEGIFRGSHTNEYNVEFYHREWRNIRRVIINRLASARPFSADYSLLRKKILVVVNDCGIRPLDGP